METRYKELEILIGKFTREIPNDTRYEERLAEELEIKPSILKKAVRTAFKASLTQTNQEHEDLNTILETVGKTL